MRRTVFRLVTLALLTSACTHSAPETASAGDTGLTITEAEIEQAQVATAYDAVMKLRANFFSNRGKTTLIGSSSPLPNVYLDGVQYGGTASLRNISAKQVSLIRLYRAWEATTKFGTGNMGGVIEVITKSQ